VLHVVKSDFDPSWRMISKYEIGRYGWLMVAAFLTLAASCVAVQRTLAGARVDMVRTADATAVSA